MPDQDSGVETFVLPTAGSRGRGRGIALEAASLAWHCPNGPCHRAFDEIVAVELDSELDGDNPYARCDIIFSNAEHLRVEITNDAGHATEIETFRAFVVRLLDALGPERRTRISFREGSGPIKRMAALIFSGAGFVAFVGIIIWLAVSGEYKEDNQYLLFPLAFLFVLLLGGMFVASLKSGRKPFDPMDIPPHALPAIPRKRRTGQSTVQARR